MYAEDDDDAFKVALALLEQLEGRQVTPNDLMACEIKLVYENKKPWSYSNKRLKLKQSKISPLYKILATVKPEKQKNTIYIMKS